MIRRDHWDSLQTRWAAGDSLTPDEERERLEYAEGDALARRELELFRELSLRASEPDAAEPANVTAALASARGVRLRVVPPGEKPRAPSAAPRWGRVALVAALAGGAVAASLALFSQRPPEALAPRAAGTTKPSAAAAATPRARSELVFASGEVWVGDSPARIGGGTLSAGARVRTAAGQACLVIDPAIDVCLGPNTSVSLESLAAEAARVRISSGTAVAELAPRRSGQRFELAAGDVTATAHGTVFALDVASDTRVVVVEGEVGVARPGKDSVALGPLSELTLGAGSSAPRALGRSDESRLRALLRSRSLWQASALGVLEVNNDAPGALASIDSIGPFALPLRALVATGEREVLLRSASGESTLRRVEVVPGAAKALERGDFPAAAGGAPATAKLLLDEARAALSKGDRRGARAAYLRLRKAYPKSPEATTVLVPLGKLELELGSPQKALAAFDAYAKTRGPLLPEALAGKIRSYRALGREPDERQSIEDYLRRFPNGFDAPALDKRLRSLSGR